MEDPWGVREKYDICMNQDKNLFSMKTRLALGYLGLFASVIVCSIVIILKDKDDILQGISSLDHLIKVSSF